MGIDVAASDIDRCVKSAMDALAEIRDKAVAFSNVEGVGAFYTVRNADQEKAAKVRILAYGSRI